MNKDKVKKIAKRRTVSLFKQPNQEWDEFSMPVSLDPDACFIAGYCYAERHIIKTLKNKCKDKMYLRTLLQEIKK